MVWKVLGPKTTLLYLFSIAATALAAGLTMDGFFTVAMPHVHHVGHDHGMLPLWLQDASAVALLAVLAWAILSPLFRRPQPHAPAPPGAAEAVVQRLELAVVGMTCDHCAATVRSALGKVAGVQAVEVDQPAGKATIRGRDLDRAALAKAVESAGYHVQG
jgi:copper chaperone CopZ